ncbi:unnamed protein product [Lupinus luteus]|uniref:Uncharacterized protein n=1 Tax=Lupinus luteus TaxID=3873 RepID=A0AAV1XSX0_LUPLU
MASERQCLGKIESTRNLAQRKKDISLKSRVSIPFLVLLKTTGFPTTVSWRYPPRNPQLASSPSGGFPWSDYESGSDVSRQDPLLKLNHANVIEVPGSCQIRVVPKAPYDFIIKNGKLDMEIPRGQKFIQTKRGSTGKSFRSNPFLGSKKDKEYVSALARQSTL